jgi:hypothetical protein
MSVAKDIRKKIFDAHCNMHEEDMTSDIRYSLIQAVKAALYQETVMLTHAEKEFIINLGFKVWPKDSLFYYVNFPD